jgi:conjugative transfer region protein (TIGR03750 family)
MLSSQAPLADRVNVEPPIINGMSQSEASYTALVAFVVWCVVGLLVAWASGLWPLFIVTAAAGTLGTVWPLSQYMATLKRNRPDGYYEQWIRRRLASVGLRRSRLICHHGHWQLGRGVR